MTTWILAVIVMASVAALGLRQGAIRVAFSFIGILAGAAVAVPLGRLVSRLLGGLIKNPLLLWALGPILGFIIVSALFKVAAAAAHQKVDVYYKYKAGDLRLAMWERLNQRLGVCLGVLNGAAYFVLIAFLIYVPSYMTVQFASSDTDPKWMRLLDVMGRDLHRTGMDKVARSFDSIPNLDYQMADFAALIYRNPLAEARLRNYPGLLGLADSPAFQALGNDQGFIRSWQQQDPIMTLLDDPNIAAIRSNPDELKTIWNTIAPDLSDLNAYLASGRSAKYDPIKILGRWTFNVGAGVAAMRRARPSIPASEMQRVRKYVEVQFGKTGLIAKPDNQISIKSLPPLKAGTPGSPQDYEGQWKDVDGKYLISFSGMDLNATVEGDRLTIKNPGMDLVFDRED
ncbi:MAG TPA: CvpA family protein [Verrucomicrobiae bacterium]|nr:CvpA family protein [Verrucomicrobiae bacterium]